MYFCTEESSTGLGPCDVAQANQCGYFFCLVRLYCQAVPFICLAVSALVLNLGVKSELSNQIPGLSQFCVPCFAFWGSLGEWVLDSSRMAMNGKTCSSSPASECTAAPRGDQDTGSDRSEADVTLLPSSPKYCKVWMWGLSTKYFSPTDSFLLINFICSCGYSPGIFLHRLGVI